MNFNKVEIEKILNYKFKNENLLKIAFTHKSYCNEHEGISSERLEFLGDSILGFVVAEYLFKKYTTHDNEGELTSYKKSLVSTVPLSRAIKKADLGKFLLVGEGVDLTGKKADRMFENLFESIVGAIYLDGGIKKASEFINDFLISMASELKFAEIDDYKSGLQIYTQSHGMGTPVYRQVSKEGPDHSPEFVVEVRINGKSIAEGKGGSKSDASKQAAKTALNKIRREK